VRVKLAYRLHADTMSSKWRLSGSQACPGFRVWVLLLLLLFLALCGIHLLGGHHDAHADELGLAIAVAAMLGAAVSRRHAQAQQLEDSWFGLAFWPPFSPAGIPAIRAPIRI
jgi:hypothetical protein